MVGCDQRREVYVICWKCGRDLATDKFYTSKAGEVVKPCKECKSQMRKEYYSRNLDRERNRNHLNYVQDKAYNHTRVMQWKKDKGGPKQRHRNAVRALLWYHVNAGYVRKPEVCGRCGARAPLHGHHEDYSKPLDVVWLCRLCHKEAHTRVKGPTA